MSHYRQALQIALAGVQGPLPDSLRAVAEEWGETDRPVQALYQAATVLAQMERCARPRPLPQHAAPAPVPAPEETLKAPEGTFARLLAQGLDNPNPFVQRDKADLLMVRGEHLPHLLLPAWLNYALTRPAPEQAVLLACTGLRGPWLAALNPDWQPLLSGEPENEAWETGTPAERSAWLAALRRRDPAEGRAALQAAWPNEPPEAREKLLPCLSTGLSMDDEALLESARTDKRKEVRRLALGLLAQLPASAYAQRMLGRVAGWLSYTPGGLLRAAKLELRLPAEYHKAWALDGIPEKTTRQHESIGDKANWLAESLGYVPLKTLFQRLEVSPATWAKLLVGHEYAAALWIGSVNSFERSPNAELLACLRATPLPALKTQLLRTSLRQAVGAADLDEWLTPLMDEAFDLDLALPLLPRLDARWSQLLLDQLRSRVAAHPSQYGYWVEMLSRFAERAHGDVLPDYLAFLDPLGNEPYAGKAVASAVAIADLRNKLHQYRV